MECVPFYTDTSLTAKTTVKERIYEESAEPIVVENGNPTTAPIPKVATKQSSLWIWGVLALGALLLAPTKKGETE